jgi:hypothetical protein
MSEEQIQEHRLRNLHESMSEEQIQEHRLRNRHESMPEEQIQQHRMRDKRFKAIEQKWKDENSGCKFCNCVHLQGASISQRKLCCQNGKLTTDEQYPKLFQLPLYLRHLILERTQHFSSRSSYYNNIFSIAVTGYDNGRQGVGCESINGPSSVKMNGRAYHFFPTSANQKFGGIANFTYDGSYQVEQHGEFLNLNRKDERVNKQFLIGNMN